MAYYNTNRETGSTLSLSWGKANKQEHYGKRYPLTSIRRAISNLTDNGKLMKLERMVMGNYGKKVHTWRLNG